MSMPKRTHDAPATMEERQKLCALILTHSVYLVAEKCQVSSFTIMKAIAGDRLQTATIDRIRSGLASFGGGK